MRGWDASWQSSPSRMKKWWGRRPWAADSDNDEREPCEALWGNCCGVGISGLSKMRDPYFKGGFCWGNDKILNAAEGRLRGAASSAALVLRMDHRSSWWNDREENTSILSTCIWLVWHLTEPGPQEVTWNMMEKGYKVKTCNIIFKSCYVIVFNCLEYKNGPATTAEILNTLSKL